MKFGLTDSEYQLIYNLVIMPLKKEGATVWCFGSRARGDNKPFSDVDLMIESSKNIDALLGKIKEDLEESYLPYKVDIALLSKFSKEYLSHFEKDKILY